MQDDIGLSGLINRLSHHTWVSRAFVTLKLFNNLEKRQEHMVSKNSFRVLAVKLHARGAHTEELSRLGEAPYHNNIDTREVQASAKVRKARSRGEVRGGRRAMRLPWNDGEFQG